MNLFRLCYIVPQLIEGQLRRKAVFEAVQMDERGNPARQQGGGFAPLLAPDGKPLRASLLLGDWEAGTGLLRAELHRGGRVSEVSNFVLSRPGEYTESRLSDGSVSSVARTVSGYHCYVRAEAIARQKDGKPILGNDGRQVWNVEDPSWVLYTSATGTFAIAGAAATTAAPVVDEAAA